MEFGIRGLRQLAGPRSPIVESNNKKHKAGYATLHPVDTGAAIPIYPSLAEGTSDRWARGEVRAHLDALRP